MCGGNIGFLRLFLGRKPSYYQYVGFWLNRERTLHRLADAIALGHAIADGTIKPSLEYWRDVSDGEGIALMRKAQHEAFVQQQGH